MTNEHLEVLLIERDPEIPKSSVGDFCVEVKLEEKILLVPADVYELLQTVDVRDAETFVELCLYYPTYFAEGLKWTQEQVKGAKIKLVAKLVGYVPDEILFPQPTKKHVYGVRLR